MGEIERFRGCKVRMRRDEVRPNFYSVYFEGGLQQMRGLNNPPLVFRLLLKLRSRLLGVRHAFTGAFTPWLMKTCSQKKPARWL
jgi:hypothetical protein